jgi:hypothetical protein
MHTNVHLFIHTHTYTYIQLLGHNLVFWKDHVAGEWRAMSDKCPHREMCWNNTKSGFYVQILRVCFDMLINASTKHSFLACDRIVYKHVYARASPRTPA